MATTRGTAIAAPQIFTSDPLEQIFARGMRPEVPGSSMLYGLLSGARMRREADQGQYLDSLATANSQAMALEQIAQQNKLKMELAKLAGDLVPKGIDATNLEGADTIFKDPNAANALAALARGVLSSKINQQNAAAAASGRSGGDTLDYTTIVGPGGFQGPTTIHAKGKNVGSVMNTGEAQRLAIIEALRNSGKLTADQAAQMLQDSAASRQRLPPQ